MKKRKYSIDYEELDELRQMGFEVHKFTTYHYRVSKYGIDKALDIFPTTKSYCISKNGLMSQSHGYEDLLFLVEDTLKF